MKIRIADQIFEIDEKTLYDWIRLGRVPLEAFIFSETLTNGQWQSVRELDMVRSLWGIDGDSTDTDISEVGTNRQSRRLDKDSTTERRFFTFQQKRPIVTLAVIAVNAIVFLLLDQLRGRSHDQQNLIQFGAYSYHLIIEVGEYWRLITHTFLHIGIPHLLLNMILLFFIGQLLEGLYGKSRYIILYFISAIGSGLASLIFVKEAIGAGASGAIFGLMGVMVAFGLRYKDQIPRRKANLFGLSILPFIGFDVLLGFIPQLHINIAAHLGGLITGFIGGLILTPAIYTHLERETKPIITFASALVSLVIVSGVIAVSHIFMDSTQIVERRMNQAFPAPSPANLPDSIERYEKAIRKRGYDPKSYAILEGLYIKALESYPQDASWLHKLKEFYERALHADPDNLAWNNNLLWLYQKTAMERPQEKAELGDYIKLCEKVNRQRGYHPLLYRNLEHFYMRAKELSPQEKSSWDGRLKDLYEKAVAKDPDNSTWSNQLAWLYVEQRIMPQRAVELAQQAVKNDPMKTTVLDTLGWASLRNGQHHKSLRAFEPVFLNPLKNEEDPKAQESSWEGLTELVQAEIEPAKSQEFDRAFLNFYHRLSRQFADNPKAYAKLEAVLELFQAKRK